MSIALKRNIYPEEYFTLNDSLRIQKRKLINANAKLNRAKNEMKQQECLVEIELLES